MENQNDEIVERIQKNKRTRTISHEWSENDTVALIHAVETKPELWKPSHSSYKNRHKTYTAWRDIEENVFNSNIKLSEITTKWNNLRVQYKSYVAKYKSKPFSSGRGQIAKWKHFDAMNFIGVNNKSSNQATVSKLPSTIVNTDSESTTSSVQSTSSIHVHNQRPKSSHSASSSRALKPNKSINNDPDNDNLILEKIQLAVDNLKNSNNDEFNIFAQFVATEIRRLPNDLQRQQLKRTIQRAIMDFNENIEKQNLAADLDGGTLNQFVVVNEAGSQIVLNSLRIPKSEEPN